MRTQQARRWVVIPALLVFGSTVTKASTIAADNLAATYSLSSFNLGIGFAGIGLGGPFSNETPAQEFTALVNGTVTILTASIQQVQPQGVPLNVSIFSMSSGLPGMLVGRVSFAQGQVSSSAHNELSSFDLSTANISLTAGHSYFAVFSAATPINGNDRYEAILLNSNAHSFGFPSIVSPDGGITWLPSVISDEIGLSVRVNQTVVPEPSSVGIAAIGIVFLLRRRKKA